MLKIHELGTADGLVSVRLRVESGVVELVRDAIALPLPDGAVGAVMRRFGAPLEPGERLSSVATLVLGAGERLSHVRHLARYDVIARDYLLYEVPGAEPLCALCTTVAAALDHLAHAAAQRQP